MTEPSMRTEHDGIGSLEIPTDALWGIGTARSVSALSFSGRALGDLPALVAALASVKAAAACANRAAGVIDEPTAAAIATVADQVRGGGHADALVADPLAGGGAIAVHVNINEVLANLANRELLGATRAAPGSYDPVSPLTVGASQSTADVVHTAGRLAVLDAAGELSAVATRTAVALDAAAGRAGDQQTLARTCLQDGLAVPARLLFDGAAAAVRRADQRVAAAVAALRQVTLGATVVGTGHGAPDAYRAAVVPELAHRTGHDLTAATDPASALQHGDDLVAVADAIATLAAVVAKPARDLRLLASGPRGGFGEVALPPVMEGSSFFAGKVNPAVPETVLQAEIQVGALAGAARSSVALAELHLHVFDLTAAIAVLDQLAMLTAALHRFVDGCLIGLTVDARRAAELATFATPIKGTP